MGTLILKAFCLLASLGNGLIVFDLYPIYLYVHHNHDKGKQYIITAGID
jgi:hypothetical protein